MSKPKTAFDWKGEWKQLKESGELEEYEDEEAKSFSPIGLISTILLPLTPFVSYSDGYLGSLMSGVIGFAFWVTRPKLHWAIKVAYGSMLIAISVYVVYLLFATGPCLPFPEEMVHAANEHGTQLSGTCLPLTDEMSVLGYRAPRLMGMAVSLVLGTLSLVIGLGDRSYERKKKRKTAKAGG
jgi:hypothetical protein